MACVIINDQVLQLKVQSNLNLPKVSELKFDFSADSRIWDKSRSIRKYVAFDLPSILSHLYASLAKNIDERKPQLSRCVVLVRIGFSNLLVFLQVDYKWNWPTNPAVHVII